jgi:pimeloyl-ACP methyl ester carboxylesterase
LAISLSEQGTESASGGMLLVQGRREAGPALIILPDLRGYGDSSLPDPGSNNINFSFSEMARDLVEVMEQLGYQRFMVAGHDRGGRTTHRLCLDHPERIIKVCILDVHSLRRGGQRRRRRNRFIEIQSALCRDKRWYTQRQHFGHVAGQEIPTSGFVAQCSEHAADNRLVGSSSPPSPTTQSYANRDFPVYCE